MFKKKVYGSSREDSCPFCGKRALTENSQGVIVCEEHKNTTIDNMKCVCGETLDMARGKWGPFFVCVKCGNLNFKRVLEMNPPLSAPVKDSSFKKTQSPKKIKNSVPDNIVVSSDEVDFL